MKKLWTKDKHRRQSFNVIELQAFASKQISLNSNFIQLIQWKAFTKKSQILKVNSKTKISNRCIKTFNKKSFSKFSNFSRTVFRKLANSGYMSNLRKAVW